MLKPEKKKVLVFCDWFVPGYKAGGPIRSVFNIVERLKKEIDFWVVTRNTDFGESKPYEKIQSDTWLEEDGYHICYLSKKKQNLKIFFRIIKKTNNDVIYLNSLFSPKFALIPLLLIRLIGYDKRIVLAPRGMLGTGALNIKSWKKKVFLRATKMIGFYRGILWHASTPVEAGQVRAVFGTGTNISVAHNLPAKPPEKDHPLEKQRGEVKLIFLARISVVKNLHLALDYLLKSANSIPDSNIFFDIYGPMEEPAYWESCEKIIKKMPSNINISYRGELPYSEVSNTLKKYHFLYLPTSTENYGHAIVECLLHGIPVIISDQTPWKNLSDYNAGWDISVPDEQKYREILHDCCDMDADEYEKWTKGAYNFAEKHIISEEVLNENLSLFVEDHDQRS